LPIAKQLLGANKSIGGEVKGGNLTPSSVPQVDNRAVVTDARYQHLGAAAGHKLLPEWLDF